MKKTLFLLALACSLPTAGHSQGFMKKSRKWKTLSVSAKAPTLRKIRRKPTTITTGTAMATNRSNAPPRPTNCRNSAPPPPHGTKQVTPSKASSIEALLKELPPLPSVDEMANPNAAARETYYRKIVAVTTRVRELDKQYTCSDEENDCLPRKYVRLDCQKTRHHRSRTAGPRKRHDLRSRKRTHHPKDR